MEGIIDQVTRGVAAVELEDDQLPRMRVLELREELRRRNLRVTGRKPELLAKLRATLLLKRDRAAENEEEADLEDDDTEAVNVWDSERQGIGITTYVPKILRMAAEEIPTTKTTVMVLTTNVPVTPVTRGRNVSQRVLLTFKDVEGSLEKFSGDSHSNVTQWLDDFEEMAVLCGWDEVAYAKRLLERSAKLFVSYEKCAKTLVKLKKALEDEFEEAVDSLQVHRDLSRRKKEHEETLQKYTYRML